MNNVAVQEASDFRSAGALLNGVMASGAIPGGIVGIGYGAEPATYLRTGTIAFDDPRPVDDDTLWRIYSMTKPVVGMATMLLIEEGGLSLDQPIADFLPAFGKMQVLTDPLNSLDSRPARTSITVRHLLTHTAGFGYTFNIAGPLLDEYLRLGITPSRMGASAAGDNTPPTASGLLEFCNRVASLPLLNEPGTRWFYSIAQDVLGGVIELASGMAFDLYLSEKLFAPLGMTSTGFQVAAKDAARLASLYMTIDDETHAADPGSASVYATPPAFAFGGTGLVSSARDYDRFLVMLLNEGRYDGREIMPARAVKRGMSNLLPDGTDLSSFIWWPDPATMGMGPSGKNAGFGACGRVALAGPDKGTYSWSGAASTNMFVDPARNLRGSAYINSMSTAFTFSHLVNKALVRDSNALNR